MVTGRHGENGIGDVSSDDLVFMIIIIICYKILLFRLKEVELCEQQEQLQRRLRRIRKAESI